ncbi:MFS transporter [Vibrio sp. MA40-2]|uniref:MFS transporter n=1 Tax=Vibrio sp. MA40-2 TaxID=3391828 RepID=UPI0039A40235
MMSSRVLIQVKPLLAVLASVYTIQSLIGMFTLQGLPAIMRSEGISTSHIGLFYLAMIPWVLKFLWAPYLEHQRKKGGYFARHAIIILSAQLVIIGTLVFLAVTASISHLEVIFISVLLLTLISTFADITADGLAVDQLPVKQRYLGNIMQVGGAYLGAVFGSGVFIYLTSIINWQYALFVLAALVLLMSLPTFSLFRLKQQSLKSSEQTKPSLAKALKSPIVRTGLILVTISQIGTRGTLSMMMPFLFDQGVSLESLGLLVAGGGVVTGVSGALLGGWLVKQISATKSLLLILILEAVTFTLLLLFSLQLLSFDWGLQILYIVNSLAAAAKFVALYTLMMEFAHGEQSGVDFSMFQSMDMLIAIVMAIVCGSIIAHFGYIYHFALLVLSTVIAILSLDRLSSSNKLLASST